MEKLTLNILDKITGKERVEEFTIYYTTNSSDIYVSEIIGVTQKIHKSINILGAYGDQIGRCTLVTYYDKNRFYYALSADDNKNLYVKNDKGSSITIKAKV